MNEQDSTEWNQGSIVVGVLSTLLVGILASWLIYGLVITQMKAHGHNRMMDGEMMMGPTNNSNAHSNKRSEMMARCCGSESGMMGKRGMMKHGMMRRQPEANPAEDQNNGSNTTVPEESGGLDQLDESTRDWIETIRGNTDPVDAREEETVEVDVGSGPSGLTFSSPVLRIDTGTTVRFRWTGKGGTHNVNFRNLEKRSSMSASQEFTFEVTFDNSGVFRYVCDPHRPLGMKGLIIVGNNQS